MSEWLKTTLGDLVTAGALAISDGYRAKNEELGGKGLIFLRAGHVTDSHIDFAGVERFIVEDRQRFEAKVSKTDDVVITTKGNSTGRTTFVTEAMEEFVYSPHLSYWRSLRRETLEPGYLRAWSRGPEFTQQLAAMSTSTDMAPYLSLVDQRRLRISLPPIDEQRAIARVLGALDDKIELNRRMNETLEAMARALFKSWFVDFDPVRAKLRGEAPAGMDAATAALFPSRLVKTEHGEVPEGWQVGSILETAALLSGGTPQTGNGAYWGGDISWASAKDVSQCTDAVLLDTERAITQRGLAESSTRLIPPWSTVVVARGATTGRLCMFGKEMAMNQTCYGLASRVNAPFSLYCHAREFIGRLVNSAHGSVFDTITTSTFAASSVVLPPAAALTLFDGRVAPLFHRLRASLAESRMLAALRDSVLPRLLSGELRVPEAERAVAEVA